jgi:hypothetical protein
MVASYHQIMPSFLDFLFSYGAQHHAKDFFFTGFRHETRLSVGDRGPSIPALGRSGRSLQLCYSLRSVEASYDQEKWPWSIRGTAAHHAFDFETGRTSWLMVKGEGGASMKERVQSETTSGHTSGFKNFDTRDQAFSSTFSSHLLLCNWAAENWRWYINYMEQEVQAITRKTLSVTVPQKSSEPVPKLLYTRTVTGILVPPKKSLTEKSVVATKKPPVPPKKPQTPPPAQGPPGHPGPPPRRATMSASATPGAFGSDTEFSFEDLRRIEYIEEHANETLLVITLNTSILTALSQHYTSIMESAACPFDLKTNCEVDFIRFVDRLSEISVELQIQKARVETLLRLLADRRALLYGILDYRSVAANRDLADKSKISADHVEYMTQQMKQEAIFMRIITLVTLFFLPGTFISTLMSTDIVRWQTPAAGGLEKVVSTGAVEVFLITTIPIMAVTFAASYGFYRWSKWQERKKLDKQVSQSSEP